MDAWRTSCPKLPVWEDANDQGLVCVENRNGRSSVRITLAGLELLKKFRPERELFVAQCGIGVEAHGTARGDIRSQ
jgi:hypothetical protein